MNEKLILKRTDRLKAGHQWVFSNEVRSDLKKFKPGSIVDLYDGRNNYFGRGYLNPHSLISVRLLTRHQEKIDRSFFMKRIGDSINYRKRLMPSRDSYRIVFSEGDFLPGLIADKYADHLVIQILTYGMEEQKELIIDIFDELLSPSATILRNDSPSRNLEGLALETKIIKGNLDNLPLIEEGNIKLEVNPLLGQKTGFFLDQTENRLALAKYAEGGFCLDLFCYTAAWGLQLAFKGADVIFIDESERALAQAAKNAKLNGLEKRCYFVKEDAFTFLKKEVRLGNKYDCIILDPPAFVKSRLKIKEAIRGYRELNYLAFKLLKDGGILATSSCSYHIDRVTFLDILRSASLDAKRDARLLEYRSQGADHPVLLSVPETEYLKCAFLRV